MFMPVQIILLSSLMILPPCIANSMVDKDCKGILYIKKAEAKSPNAKMIITKQKT